MGNSELKERKKIKTPQEKELKNKFDTIIYNELGMSNKEIAKITELKRSSVATILQPTWRVANWCRLLVHACEKFKEKIVELESKLEKK